MLVKIDKYVITSFVPTFFLCMFAICGLYIVADVLQKLDDYIEMGSKALMLSLNYYAFMVPVILVQLFPTITLIAVSVVLVKFARNNEILAMQVAGISIYRILLPIFIISVLLSFVSVVNQELLIPKFAERLKKVEQLTFEEHERSNILVEDKLNRMLFRAWNFNIAEGTLKSVFIIGRNENGKKKFTIKAKNGKWAGEDKWLLFNVTKHNYDEDGKWIAPGENLDQYLLETSLTPEQLNSVDIHATLKSFMELKKLCEAEPENMRFSVMYHSRVAYPFTSFVLLFIGIPLVIGFERMSKNAFLRVGMSIIICLAFYVLSYVCINLGNIGILHPILAAWLPITIFGSFGLYLFDGMNI